MLSIEFNGKSLMTPKPRFAVQSLGTGQYYTGRAGEYAWGEHRSQAFTYTLEGAKARIDSCPLAFQNCTVVVAD